MKKFIYLSLLLICVAVISCSQKTTERNDNSLVCLDLEKNIGFNNPGNLKPNDLTLIRLVGFDADFEIYDSRILDIEGDTLFLLNSEFMPTKIIMFSLSSGMYLGEINHQGEGHGEYRFIFGAFVDPADQTVLIPDFDRPFVYEYSLLSDSLVKTYDRPELDLRFQPVGNIKNAINFAEPQEKGLNILQCGSKFEILDTLLLEGVRLIPFTTIWAQSGENGILFDRDTLSVIDTDHLTPVVSVDCGKNKLKEEIAIETIEGLISTDEPDSVYLKRLDNYIIIRDFQFTRDNILVTYIYEDKNYSDLYDLRTGEILNRFESEKDFNGPCTMVLENNDGDSLKVVKLFTKDNTWYGLYHSAGTSGSTPEICIVKFKI